MAFEFRRPEFNLSGTLISGIAAGDLQIASNAFQDLPTDYSSSLYMPLVIADDAQGRAEIVWVTGHATAGSSVTVHRGREGTTPQAFDAGTVVRCAPTLRDVDELLVATRGALPADAHVGLRVVIQDEGRTALRRLGEWVHESPFYEDPARRHAWSQVGGAINPTGALITCSGLTPIAGNGDIATYAGGNLRLNRPGMWSLTWHVFGDINTATAGWQLAALTWDFGAFLVPLQQRIPRIGAQYDNSRQIDNLISWVGYVNEAQAEQPIKPQVAQDNVESLVMNETRYDLRAEFLGA